MRVLQTSLSQNAFAKGLTEVQVNEWKKVKGRFKEVTFTTKVKIKVRHILGILGGKDMYRLTVNRFLLIYYQLTIFVTSRKWYLIDTNEPPLLLE